MITIEELEKALKVLETRATKGSDLVVIGQYKILGIIGEGSFGTVHLARHIPTEQLVAVKILEKIDNPLLDSEIDIAKSLDHPCVVRTFEVLETTDKVFLVMEYVHGRDLLHHLQESRRMREDEARAVFHQLLRAVQHCHENGIAHRDIKLENVLIDLCGRVKLCDFGLGTRFTPGQKLEVQCGSLPFWAPEQFLEEGYYGDKVDVWSLGVVLYTMLMGQFPFRGRTWSRLQAQVSKGNFILRRYLSEESKSLLALLLTTDPEHRPSLARVLRHPWLRNTQAHLPPRHTPLYQPDPDLIKVMTFWGFKPNQVWEALMGRRFDATMATYLIIAAQREQRSDPTGQMRHPIPGPPPCPSPAGAWMCTNLRKSTSLPTRHPASCLPAELQAQKDGIKCTTSTSTLCLLSAPWIQSPKEEEEEEEGCNSSPLQPAAANSSSPDTAATQDDSRGWRKIKGRIIRVLQVCCCCLPFLKRRSGRVHPATGDASTTHLQSMYVSTELGSGFCLI
ncbi:PREDICTED: sperm motility kinase Z-like [Dipodomys ordii]|uniref:non-specific serine/threonine protein kinase n=1 Tax=Dipodomys ordii TaxID=10020 RepID=A0A1S3GRI4_DIPOR|nr:PREDICTED: sperm motility kinase Z-like [Dipodomys ordii]